jgi:hypothetical protein
VGGSAAYPPGPPGTIVDGGQADCGSRHGEAQVSEHLEDMTTGQVRQRAEQAGINDADQKNKGEMINALGGDTNTEHGGDQTQKDPKPQGADPADYKNIPGNQT